MIGPALDRECAKNLALYPCFMANCPDQRKEVVLSCMKVYGLWRWSSAERR